MGKEPKYDKGDVVCHVISEEKAKIVDIIWNCSEHVDRRCMLLGAKEDCVPEFTGEYRVSDGFGENYTVPEEEVYRTYKKGD